MQVLHGSQARNRHIWTWRSCFCYQIQWETPNVIKNSEFQNLKKLEKSETKSLLDLFLEQLEMSSLYRQLDMSRVRNLGHKVRNSHTLAQTSAISYRMSPQDNKLLRFGAYHLINHQVSAKAQPARNLGD